MSCPFCFHGKDLSTKQPHELLVKIRMTEKSFPQPILLIKWNSDEYICLSLTLNLFYLNLNDNNNLCFLPILLKIITTHMGWLWGWSERSVQTRSGEPKRRILCFEVVCCVSGHCTPSIRYKCTRWRMEPVPLRTHPLPPFT